MDRLLLSRIDEELDSSEVAELCFLCSDVVNRKRLEGIKDAKELFIRLEEKGLLENSSFLSQLLRTIHRADLLNLLECDSRQVEETDANPFLSQYRLMLYRIHEDLTEENLSKMKFLLKDKMAKRHLEMSSTALNVFAEMEKACLISSNEVDTLHTLLLEFDQQLAMTVQDYMERLRLFPTAPPNKHLRLPCGTSEQQKPNDHRPSLQPSLSTSETQPYLCKPPASKASLGSEKWIFTDNTSQAESPLSDDTEYYTLTNRPRGLCVIINNEIFTGTNLHHRTGSNMDKNALESLFKRFGFDMNPHDNLTAQGIIETLNVLSKRDFSKEDALVVCVLTHGEKGVVYGTDAKEVKLEHLIEPFRNNYVPSLFGKPKLFFIQACQGECYQEPVCPCKNPDELLERKTTECSLEEDCSPEKAVATDADILVGMATVPNHKCYRNTVHGSLYIQELCRQLQKAAESPENDDILTVLTRVNREVSKNDFAPKRQMPEPKYTLTKRLVLRFV